MEIASKSNNFHYNKKLKNFANYNRKNLTKSAILMWKYLLSKRQMLGYQFRRERPILDFIVDFVCLDLMLVIEVDGITHETDFAERKDIIRDKKLKEIGFTVLRFSSWELFNKIDDVSIIIGDWIKENAKCPPPNPRQRGKKN